MGSQNNEMKNSALDVVPIIFPKVLNYIGTHCTFSVNHEVPTFKEYFTVPYMYMEIHGKTNFNVFRNLGLQVSGSTDVVRVCPYLLKPMFLRNLAF